MATAAPISGPAPTIHQSSSGEHGFFETFPRELRDKIYALIYREVGFKYRAYHRVRITVPLVVVRLISRQFKFEYDEQCSRSDYIKQLTILDRRNMSDDIKSIKENPYFDEGRPPPLAARSTNLTAILASCTCAYRPEGWPTCIVMGVLGIVNLVDEIAESLPHLSSKRIYLTTEKDGCVEDILKELKHELRDDGHHARRLENLKLILLHPGCKFIEGRENRVLATWTKQDGLVKDEEAVNGCLERVAATRK